MLQSETEALRVQRAQESANVVPESASLSFLCCVLGSRRRLGCDWRRGVSQGETDMERLRVLSAHLRPADLWGGCSCTVLAH